MTVGSVDGENHLVSPTTDPSRHRNPDWAVDELLLALDLYLRRGPLGNDDRDVLALSALLRSLPIHTIRPDPASFRNPNGVALKLANFASIDAAHPGLGMRGRSQRDQQVWDRFAGRPSVVATLAASIQARGSTFPAVEEEGEDEADEGRLLFRQHRSVERNRRLRERKKRQVRARTGRLACEVCAFDFEATYGPAGRDFIECHHLAPLAETGRRSTRLNDLALLCSNCHRVAHRVHPWPTVADLRNLIHRA